MAARMRAGWTVTSYPATQARPDVGGRSVVSILISVVFPAPLGPTRPRISPGAMSTDTAFTAVRSPKPLVSSEVRMAAAEVDAAPATPGGTLRFPALGVATYRAATKSLVYNVSSGGRDLTAPMCSANSTTCSKLALEIESFGV